MYCHYHHKVVTSAVAAVTDCRRHHQNLLHVQGEVNLKTCMRLILNKRLCTSISWTQAISNLFTSSEHYWATRTIQKSSDQVRHHVPTRCSAIAERPHCRVHYSFRQK